MISYVRIGILVSIFMAGLFLGWYYEHRALVAYKAEIENLAKIQEEKVKSIRSQQELVNKGITDAYEAKLAAIRNYYKPSSVWDSNSSKVSGISTAPSKTDVITAYNLLAGQCANTTAQAIELQNWINEQIAIK